MIEYPQGTVEYVWGDLVEKTGKDLTDIPVLMAIHESGDRVWLSAVWEDGAIRTATPVDFGTLRRAVYDVYAKLPDTPESPVIHLGQIRVTK